MITETITFKLIFHLIFPWVPLLIYFIALNIRAVKKILFEKPAVILAALYFGSRILFFIVLYVFFEFKGLGDLNVNYFEPAQLAWRGFVPYRDFSCSYSPLFLYLLAPLTPLGIKGILLLFVVFDFITLLFLNQTASLLFGQETRCGALYLYVVSPMSWFFLIYMGQDEILLSFILILLFYLHLTGRDRFIPIVAAGGFVLTKFLAVLVILPFFLASQRKFKFVLEGGIIVGAILAFFKFYLKADILEPLLLESKLSGGNGLWDMLERIQPFSWNIISHLLLAVVLLALIIWATKHIKYFSAYKLLMYSLLLWFVFMGLSYKAWSLYSTIYLTLLTIFIVRENKIKSFVLYAILKSFGDYVAYEIWNLPELHGAEATMKMIAFVIWGGSLFISLKWSLEIWELLKPAVPVRSCS